VRIVHLIITLNRFHNYRNSIFGHGHVAVFKVKLKKVDRNTEVLKDEAVRQQFKEKTEELFKTMQDSNDVDHLWTEMKSVITEVAEDTCEKSKPKFRKKWMPMK